MIRQVKILFMGSPEYAIPTLEALNRHPACIIQAVLSRPDKPKGRSKTPVPTPVKQWAIDHQLKTDEPTTKDEIETLVNAYKPDYLFVVAYGLFIPSSITDHYVCINSHPSLLPKYRGPSPIQAPLLNQDKQTGVTYIRINNEMDAGDIISQSTYTIQASDNFETLHNLLAKQSADLATEILDKLPDITFTPQNHDEATLCNKIEKNDYKLDKNDPIHTNLAKIKAFSPFPGAFIIQEGKTIKILDAEIQNNELIPLIVKPEGKGKMAYKDYLLGNKEGLSLC